MCVCVCVFNPPFRYRDMHISVYRQIYGCTRRTYGFCGIFDFEVMEMAIGICIKYKLRTRQYPLYIEFRFHAESSKYDTCGSKRWWWWCTEVMLLYFFYTAASQHLLHLYCYFSCYVRVFYSTQDSNSSTAVTHTRTHEHTYYIFIFLVPCM